MQEIVFLCVIIEMYVPYTSIINKLYNNNKIKLGHRYSLLLCFPINIGSR